MRIAAIDCRYGICRDSGGVKRVITLPKSEPIASAGTRFKGYKLNGDDSKLYQAGDTVVVNQELAKGNIELKFEAVYENTATVILYNDGTMIFYDTAPRNAESLHGGVRDTFVVGENDVYTWSDVPWSVYFDSGEPSVPQPSYVKNVSFETTSFAPVSLAYWFDWGLGMESFDGSGLDTSRVTDMCRLFNNSSVNSIQGVNTWNVENVKNMSLVFAGCTKLVSLDLTGWDVSNVEDMSGMFGNTGSALSRLTSLSGLQNWDVSNVTNMSGMFSGCSNWDMAALDLSGWDVGNVTDMSGMFGDEFSAYAYHAEGVGDISDWDTRSVIDMSSMFGGTRFEDIDLSGWDISNVRDMEFMFSDSSFRSIDLSGWDVPNVDMGSCHEMFANCSNLSTIYAKDWTTSGSVSYSRQVFAGSEKLPGYAESRVDGSMCKPQSLGGYFTEK